MAKKASAKRAFDWRTYSKPARLLSVAQEDAFTSGILAPVLAWVAEDPRSRFEIRARAAGLYHRGVSLARVMGEEPFVAELEPAEGAAPERLPLESDSDVTHLLDRLAAAREAVDDALDSDEAPRHRRSYSLAIAEGNSGIDLFEDEIVVVDAEYALGRRKVDLVALVRTEGVTGPGAFANPTLAFIDVRVPGQSLTGGNGLASVAADVAEYCKALSGEHLERTAEEIDMLVAQKVRLGLLPDDLEVRSVESTLPKLIVAFAERDPREPANDAAIVELHEKLAARHYPTELLRFLDFVEVPEDGEGLALGAGDAMTYREFKAYRMQDR